MLLLNVLLLRRTCLRLLRWRHLVVHCWLVDVRGTCRRRRLGMLALRHHPALRRTRVLPGNHDYRLLGGRRVHWLPAVEIQCWCLWNTQIIKRLKQFTNPAAMCCGTIWWWCEGWCGWRIICGGGCGIT